MAQGVIGAARCKRDPNETRTRSGQKWAEVELQRTELSGLERNPNGTRTEPERNPNGTRTEPERNPNGTRTEPERDGAKWGASKGYAADCKVQKYRKGANSGGMQSNGGYKNIASLLQQGVSYSR
ncbi:hypothetical protein JZ785_14620 [Alicyclobacillus curvatus]|nr:hypothetical protein JZ785_14620 [Alicyclobacillus curvatus]